MSRPGAAPVTAPGWTAKPKKGVALVDCDIHHNFKSASELMPYLPKFYQEHLIDQGIHLPSAGYANVPFRTNRPDLKDPDLQSREVNFSLEFMQKEHLDRWNIDIALLAGPPPFYAVSGLPDPDWADALCRAFNDWTIEHWLDKDDRVVNAILVAPNDPAQASTKSTDWLAGRIRSP